MTDTSLTLDETADPKGGRYFDPWRLPRSGAAREVIADILNQVQNYEGYLRHHLLIITSWLSPSHHLLLVIYYYYHLQVIISGRL